VFLFGVGAIGIFVLILIVILILFMIIVVVHLNIIRYSYIAVNEFESTHSSILEYQMSEYSMTSLSVAAMRVLDLSMANGMRRRWP
jgi:hypothetical protein